MGDTEAPKTESISSPSGGLGFSHGYLLSVPGVIRILNIVLGAISLGLWIPGYEHEFLGERINQNTGDTSKGYGNGFKRETLNQFVLAAIIIALGSSAILILGLVAVQHASVDWNRFNKFSHLALGIFLLIASICSAFGTWYFQENCCHVDMEWSGLSGIRFKINGAEGYVRHCNCYLTKYLGYSESEQVTDTVLYEATKFPDNSGFNDQWTWMAHHMKSHIAAVFIIFLNAFVYLAAFIFSKAKSMT